MARGKSSCIIHTWTKIIKKRASLLLFCQLLCHLSWRVLTHSNSVKRANMALRTASLYVSEAERVQLLPLVPSPAPFVLNWAQGEKPHTLSSLQRFTHGRTHKQAGICSGYLNWCSDALLVATETFTLLPTHGLQHFVPNIVTIKAIFSRLFIVTAREEKKGHFNHMTKYTQNEQSDSCTDWKQQFS